LITLFTIKRLNDEVPDRTAPEPIPEPNRRDDGIRNLDTSDGRDP
jgi:hypothetical protein